MPKVKRKDAIQIIKAHINLLNSGSSVDDVAESILDNLEIIGLRPINSKRPIIYQETLKTWGDEDA